MTLNFVVLVLASALVSTAYCQGNIDIDSLKQHLPGNLQSVNLPSPDDLKKVVRDKCTRVSGNEAAFKDVEKGAMDFFDCVKDLIDLNEFQNEIETAKPTGDLDLVFNKYCRKRATLIECVNTFSNTMDSCLEEEEKKSKQVALNVFTNVLNFVCYKDGDQIALFIAEKGPECFLEKKDGLINCVNQTYAERAAEVTADSFPKLVMGTKECADVEKLQVCVVKVLEECEESTPANLVEAMFKFMKKGSPCAATNKARRSIWTKY